MTVIAWDGTTLAADKRANNQGTITIVTKIRKLRGHLVGACDDLSSCIALLHWFESGADIEKWPEFQKDNERWAPLVIITPERQILRYERTPYPFTIEQKFYALGSGRDFALGALEMGATAEQAVLAASKWDAACGNGVDHLTFD